MILLQAHEQSKKYFSDDFIEGFNLGAKAQYSRDKEEKTGKWIKHDNELLGLTYECSVCHIEGMLHTPFCPICGARMNEEENNDNNN